MGPVDEPAAWHELEAVISGALWRYAEAVTGVRRDDSGRPVTGTSFQIRDMYLARVAAARRSREVLDAAKAEAASGAFEWHAIYPVIAAAAGISWPNAWKRYRSCHPRPERPGRLVRRPVCLRAQTGRRAAMRGTSSPECLARPARCHRAALHRGGVAATSPGTHPAGAGWVPGPPGLRSHALVAA